MEKLGDTVDNPQQLNAQAEKFFNEMDSDGNGKIDDKELKSSFEQLGLTLTNKEIKSMIYEADQDGCARAASHPLPSPLRK